jgi:hypothetical protein
MRLPLYIALALGLLACKGGQRATEGPASPADTQAARPDWVRSRPVSSMYYIGIGLASKNRPDHQESAKKAAFNDLASEISVLVEGNSLLSTLDQRNRFSESYTSTIRTRTSEQLEAFELVDTYETPTEYWIYYRLSRSEHARLKAQRKARAIANATDLHARSRESLALGDLRTAFDQALRALLAMQDHWGENDLVDIEGRQVPLANEIYSDLQRMTSGVQLAILPERCVLDYGNRYRREMLITATYRGNGANRSLVQLPLVVVYPGISGKVTEMKNTDGEGRLRTAVMRVDATAAGKEMLVRLDLDGLVSSELEPALTRAITASLTVPEQRAPIDVTMPRVLMRSQEANMGGPVNDAGISLVVREELTRRGFRFVDREGEADLLLVLNASTREGGEASGFFTAFLDVSYSFRDMRSQEVLYEGGRQGVKGVQLDHRRAGLDAYKRASQEVRNELVPAMMNVLQ